MKTEQQALKVSLVAVLVFSALGISFGLISGSYAIIFDGVFSLVDALMSVVAIIVSGLILRSTSNTLSSKLRRRFTMGFWHFEPMVLAFNGLVMMSIGIYALVQAVLALLSGGRDIEFGPAVAYAGIILVLTSVVGFLEYRANKRLKSALVEIDVKGWLMAGGITAALLVAFLIGLIIDGTRFDHLMPYIDPAVLALVSIFLIPVPFSILRRALGQMALVTPAGLQAQAEEEAQKLLEAEGFLDYRVYVAQVGRAKQVELVFHVPASMPPKPLEEWDRIRTAYQQVMDAKNPDNWISVTFTTKDSAMR